MEMELLKLKIRYAELKKMVGQTGRTKRKGGGSIVGAASHLSQNGTTYKREFFVVVDDAIQKVRYGLKVEVNDFLEASVKKVVVDVKNRDMAITMVDVVASQMYKDCEAGFEAFCANNPGFMAECTQAEGIPLPTLTDMFRQQIGRQEGIKKVIKKNADKVAAAALAVAKV